MAIQNEIIVTYKPQSDSTYLDVALPDSRRPKAIQIVSSTTPSTVLTDYPDGGIISCNLVIPPPGQMLDSFTYACAGAIRGRSGNASSPELMYIQSQPSSLSITFWFYDSRIRIRNGKSAWRYLASLTYYVHFIY